MDSLAVAALICPVCAASFDMPAPEATALRCTDGHSFDVAKQGYVNLLTGAGTHFQQDSAEMVQARADFLGGDFYRPMEDALAKAVLARLGPDPALVVDAGTGTGHYLQGILGAAGQAGLQLSAVGMDISKFALRRAARLNPQALNLVWDIWKPWPLAAGTADAIVVVFAPRNPGEFARILRTGGSVLVVTPLPEHLAEIAGVAGLLGIQPGKEQELNDAMSQSFSLGPVQEIHAELELAPADVANLALMGPAGHHLDAAQLAQRVAELPDVTRVSAAFRLSEFHRLPKQGLPPAQC